MSMQNDLLKEALGKKALRPSAAWQGIGLQFRERAAQAVAPHGASIELACRAFQRLGNVTISSATTALFTLLRDAKHHLLGNGRMAPTIHFETIEPLGECSVHLSANEKAQEQEQATERPWTLQLRATQPGHRRHHTRYETENGSMNFTVGSHQKWRDYRFSSPLSGFTEKLWIAAPSNCQEAAQPFTAPINTCKSE